MSAPVLSDKAILAGAKRFGFSTVTKATTSRVNAELRRIARRSQEQRGGAPVLPSEYFGVDSGAYHDSVPHTDMSSTTTLARPALAWSASGGGGHGPIFAVSAAAAKRALASVGGAKGPRVVERVRRESEQALTRLFAAATCSRTGSPRFAA